MRRNFYFIILALVAISSFSCVKMEDVNVPAVPEKRKLDFDITVTRDGKTLGSNNQVKSDFVDAADLYATMHTNLPFGLVGIDEESNKLVIDNSTVYFGDKGYSGYFNSYLWDMPSMITLSAYYPHVSDISYGDDYSSYSIPFEEAETDAGPLVSRTVRRAIDQMNIVPLEFQHITDDIGFKVCDVTPKPELQGLIRLRKVTATYVASAGVYRNDLESGHGYWHKQGYYRDVVVFEGDAPVGVGSENEKFIGHDALVDRLVQSHRYYAIPDELRPGKQCVEVLFDVEGFHLNNYYYEPLKNQRAKYMLYGLLPDNVMAYGKQYTFHLGLDLSRIYHEITFAPSVSEWETKIYENNDDF